MNHKIAILSDIHGNTTALAGVLEDAKIWERLNIGFWEIFFFLGRSKWLGGSFEKTSPLQHLFEETGMIVC